MSDLHKKLVNKNIPHGLNSKPPVPNKSQTTNKTGHKKVSFTPILWSKYFEHKEDILIGQDSFRIYHRGKDGPVLFFLHGGGFSALTWALLSQIITEDVNCRCLAMDLRGHGDTKTMDDLNVSIDQLSQDVISLIHAIYPEDIPPIVLIGHSMGGAIAAHTASLNAIQELVGLVVIDVVEGTALDALYSMQSFLRSRPSKFKSLEYGIEWSVRSCQIRNAESARVSFPGQLKNESTGETATSELERLPLSSFSVDHEGVPAMQQPFKASEKRSTEAIDEADEEMEEEDCRGESNWNHPGAAISATVSQFKDPNIVVAASTTTTSSTSTYTWRIDLTKTEDYWTGWFEGLSKKFLSFHGPKLLLLAGVDRLDKELTIGQMQGKFQMNVLPQSGHAIHEDIPEKVADCLATYLVRNKLSTAKSDFEKVFPCC